MTQLTGKAVVAVKQLTIDDDTRTYARAQGDDDEVLHAASHTIDHLADSGGISVVGECYGDVVQALAEELCQRHDAVVGPRQIGSKLDGAVVEVTVGGADTHRLDLLNAAHLVDNHLQSLDTGIHIVFHLIVATCLDGSSCLDFTTGIYNAEDGVCSS